MTLTHPFGQCRTGWFDSFTGIDFTLPIQGEVIGVFGHEHVRQQTGPGQAARDWTRGRGRMCRIPRKLAGTYSSCSLTSSPSRLSSPITGGAVFGFGRMLDTFAGQVRG